MDAPVIAFVAVCLRFQHKKLTIGSVRRSRSSASLPPSLPPSSSVLQEGAGERKKLEGRGERARHRTGEGNCKAASSSPYSDGSIFSQVSLASFCIVLIPIILALLIVIPSFPNKLGRPGACADHAVFPIQSITVMLLLRLRCAVPVPSPH